jgi:hypothetical protein
VVQTVTSSVVYSSGSNVFGNNIANTQTFTGSVSVSGSGAFIGIVGVGGATEAGWSLKSNGNLKVENSNGTTVLQVNDTSTGGKAWSLISAGAGNAHSVAAGTFYLRNSSDSSTAFTIASTGAATFSSTISAGVITGDSNSTGTPSIVAKVGSGGNNGTFGFGNNSNYRIRGGSDYGAMIFDTAGAEQMRLTGGGTTTLQLSTYTGNSDIQLTASTTGYSSVLFGDGASGINQYRGYIQYQHNGDYFIFATDSTEKMRITSTGFLKASNTSGYYNPGLYHELRTNSTDEWTTIISNSAASPYGINVRFSATSPNGTVNYFLECTDTTTNRLRISSNGNVTNINGSYGTISSDRRLKENIVNATPKLDDLLKLNVVNFNLIGNEDKHIGFIAQEMQEIFPSFVYQNDTRKYDEDGNVISGLEDALGVKVGMEFAILVKAIQEQQTLITALQEKLERNNII